MEDSSNNITLKSGHYKITYQPGKVQVWDRFPGATTLLYEFPTLDGLVDLLRKGEKDANL